MNNFIVGFGFCFSRGCVGYGDSFYFAFLFGKFGKIIVFRHMGFFSFTFAFRRLDKAMFEFLNLRRNLFLFSFSRGYHFLVDDGSEWLSDL